MALTDSASAVILSKLAPGWNFMTDELQANGEGWDLLTVTMVKDYGSELKTASQVAAEWPTGTRVFPGRNFWVTSRKPDNLGANVWQIQLTCSGLNDAARPIKVTINGTSEVQSFPSGGAELGPPVWPYPILALTGTILEAQPSFSLSYVLIGTHPATGTVGLSRPDADINSMLGFDLAVRPSVWVWLASPALHTPFGWTLNDMPADVLNGTDTPVSLVTENWIYRRQYTP